MYCKINNVLIVLSVVSVCLLSCIIRGGGGGLISLFFLISCFYHSENMYWVTLNVKINSKNF